MSLYNGPARGGNRGGKDQFNWDSVKNDKDREFYLGHSVKASTGRWQKGRNLKPSRNLSSGRSKPCLSSARAAGPGSPGLKVTQASCLAARSLLASGQLPERRGGGATAPPPCPCSRCVTRPQLVCWLLL